MKRFIAYLRVSTLALVSLAVFTPEVQAQFYSQQSLYQARRACNPTPPPRYIPGHYEISEERIFIPGSVQRVFVPARYVTRCGLFGIRYQRKVAPAHYQNYREPGHYELRKRKTWVPGRYIY